jgi:hypothetical protein
MKKLLILFSLFSLLFSLALAIDDADGLGRGALKLETDTVLPAKNIMINYGLSDDLTGYILVNILPMTNLVGTGISYPLLSENRGDYLSLAPKLEQTGWNNDNKTGYGLTFSKRVQPNLCLLLDASQNSVLQGTFSWVAVGFLYNLTDALEFTLESGKYSEDVPVAWLDFVNSRPNTAFGFNYLFGFY